jgi:hypothetical protein
MTRLVDELSLFSVDNIYVSIVSRCKKDNFCAFFHFDPEESERKKVYFIFLDQRRSVFLVNSDFPKIYTIVIGCRCKASVIIEPRKTPNTSLVPRKPIQNSRCVKLVNQHVSTVIGCK